ncbi:hypothetical protein ACFL20_02880 [Spirochaetota bacterium]
MIACCTTICLIEKFNFISVWTRTRISIKMTCKRIHVYEGYYEWLEQEKPETEKTNADLYDSIIKNPRHNPPENKDKE